MLTKKKVMHELAGLEKKYADFIIERFSGWRLWAEAAQNLLDGKDVEEDTIPPAFLFGFKLAREVLQMEATGEWDWSSPVLGKIFEEMARDPLYLMTGDIITEISLRLADVAGVKTLVEVGAGRGHLTAIMFEKAGRQEKPPTIVITDADADTLQTVEKLKKKYQGLAVEMVPWNIREAAPERLKENITPPCLVYERASLIYAGTQALPNIAEVADIAVLSDSFNYTGDIYAYDRIMEKIGARPLLYRDLAPLLKQRFREHFMFDQRAQQVLGMANTSMLVAYT